ncbi:VIT domain-containing protein [Steroidobacter sp.]|uniref:VIT domain-containing protein n=1 Tax=Steroidobacter sp. TaxID=1978227 RepID=UPI001A5D1107|nr:VIT domain-containing protein [Steroidobacter sp.]MBL8267474.1 hypothetical protein [Steroidobacter sp.]
MAATIPPLTQVWADRWQSRPGFISLLFGVVLPLITLIYELATHACASMMFDPIPTPLHVILVALVPAANLFVWWTLRDTLRRPKLLAFANGMAIGVAAFYSLLFIPILPAATIGIIFFGLGLLPWAPAFSLTAAIVLRVHLTRAADREQRSFATWPGLVCALLTLIAIELPNTTTAIGLKMATSESVPEQSRGVRLLRAVGDDDLLLRYCYFRTGRGDLLGVLMNISSVTPTGAREVYYRVTGEPFSAKPVPAPARSRGWWGDGFDSDQGTDVVGGQLPGLSLASSRLDGSLDAGAALGYVEWTLVMKNNSQMPREARAQVALPPGAVVSRLTLWVNGEEREAAFAARGQVTQAYRAVVQQRRDPVLVTTAGTDRIAVQMFPVPADGEMKVRIGMTVPLELDHLRQASLQLPYFHERNFAVGEDFKHFVWIEAKAPLSHGQLRSQSAPGGAQALQMQLTDRQLMALDTAVTMSRDRLDASWSHDAPAGNEIVKQTLQAVTASTPSRLVVVVDSSASVASSAQQIAEVVSRLPTEPELFLIVADDAQDMNVLRAPTTPRDAAASIRDYNFVGGQDNTLALSKALDLLTKPDGALIWIHGAQPVVLQTTASIEQRFERRGQVQWYDVQVAPGPNRIGENLDGLARIRTMSLSKLQSLITRWRSGGSDIVVRREKIAGPAPASEVGQTSDHLARLWAHEEVQRLLYDERDSRAAAVELAHRYRLVTPVTGAVVLETQQQYDAAGLTPVPEGTVPSIPEPEEWALLAIAVAVILYSLRRRQVGHVVA